MTKRNLFATLAAIFVSAAFLAGCDHALSQQTASVTFVIPADVIMAMTKEARPASEAEMARAASLASRQAAGSTDAYATLTVSLSEHAQPQTRFFTEEEFNAIESGASAIAPFDFTGLPVGARVTVTAALLLTDGMYYEDSAEVALAVGPNSVSLTMRAKTQRLALVSATHETGKQLAQGESVTFSHNDGNATIVLAVSPADGVTYGDGNTPIGANGVTGSGSITLRFNNVTTSGNPSYTVTARATRNDPTYIDSTAVFTYTVQGDALNQVTVSPPRSDVALIRGENSSVTFSHGDNAATIHLRVSPTAGVTYNGGTQAADEITGIAGQPVALDFTAAGNYTVTAWATRDGYANSSEATFPYTVVNPKLEGKVEATAGGALTMVEGQAAVTFTYTNNDVSGASIVLTGLPTNGAGFTVANGNGSAISVSDGGTYKGAAGQSVTVTFTAEDNYNNITAYAEKADYEKSDGITVSYNVQRPQLGVVTMSRTGSATGEISNGATNVALTRNDVVTFSYASADGVRDAQIVVSGLPDSGVSVMSGNLRLSGTTVTGVAGQSVVVTFTAADATQRTITAKATRAHHTDSPEATFSYTVANPKLGGTISANPTSTTLTRGQTVTFTYTDGSGQSVRNSVIINLTLSDAAGVKMNGNQISSTTVEGTNPITLTFEPTEDNKTYSITNVYASLTDYQNSNTADFNYTVDFPQLSGTFTANNAPLTGAVNTLSRGDTVTFRYNDSNGVTGAQVVVSGLPSGATATSNGQNLDLSNGTVTGEAGQSVTVTFGSTTNSNSTITVKATKQYYREAMGQSYVCKVDDPKLTGRFTASKNTGGNLTEGDNTANPNTLTRGESVTFSYTNTNSPTVTDAQIVVSGLPSGATVGGTAVNGTYTGGTGQPVIVTFTSNVIPASTISVRATKADYQDTTETRYAYTVGNPTLSGGMFSVTANNATLGTSATIPTRAQVTFTYSNTSASDTKISLALTKTGGGTVTTSDVTVTGGTLSGGTVTATGSAGNSVTLTFNTANTYTITPSGTKTDYEAQRGTAYTYTVANFAIGDTLTGLNNNNATVTLPTTTYGSNNTYLLGTDVSSLRVTLNAGGSGYTGNGVSWSVTTNPASSSTITPTSAGNGNWNLPLASLATNAYTLTVQATVYGVEITQTFNILKFADSGNLALSGNVAITNGTLTIAPTSAVVISPAGDAGIASSLFTVSGSGSLTLGGSATVQASHGLGAVTVDGGNLTLQNSATVTYGGSSESTKALVAVNGGEFTMNGGTISGNKRSSNSGNGGGVEVAGGAFTMNDGLISTNTARDGGGVYVGNSTFTMNGGMISGNTASDGGTNGGGVYVDGGNFTMSGGTISRNTAFAGGGIYVVSGTFDFNYDTSAARSAISTNIAEGGDVYVAEGVNYTNPYRRQQTVSGGPITTIEGLTLGGATPGI